MPLMTAPVPRLVRALAWIFVLVMGQWAQLALAAPAGTGGLDVARAWHHQADMVKEGAAALRFKPSSEPADEPLGPSAQARLRGLPSDGPADLPRSAQRVPGVAVAKGFDSCGPPGARRA